MGGYGSGARLNKKPTVEDARTLNLSVFVRDGSLRGDSFKTGTLTWRIGERAMGTIGYTLTVRDHDGEIRLAYTVRETTPVDERIGLEACPQSFGGVRWWFRCPRCNRRAGKLHLPPGGTIFVCRICGGLTYESAQKHDARLDALRRNPAELLARLHRSKGGDMLAFRAGLKVFEGR